MQDSILRGVIEVGKCLSTKGAEDSAAIPTRTTQTYTDGVVVSV